MNDDEQPLVQSILELSREFPSYGNRMVTRLLRQEGWTVNFKRIYRLWKREGHKVSMEKRKKRRLGTEDGSILRRQSDHPNHVWSIDFIFDRTEDGCSLKILSAIDEFTRQCIVLEVHRRFTSEDLVFFLRDLFQLHEVPEFIRGDNGPEFITKSLREFLALVDVGACYIEPGSPWQNGFVESFHSRFRDECLACEVFSSVAEARKVIALWKETYDHRRPHSSLGGTTPANFARQFSASSACASEAESCRTPAVSFT